MQRRTLWNLSLSLALAATPMLAQAQTATIYGSLGNFDVVNDTGQDAHGFEIQFEGLSEADVYYSFSAERYGSPTLVPHTGGVTVRWMSSYDASTQQFSERTLAHAPNTPFGGTCYQWYPASYPTAGCEHFGVSLKASPTQTTYRWLIADAQAPGVLTPVDPPVPIVAPVYIIVPPVQAGDPPVLEVEVQAPEPAESPERYGDAQWMKVFVTELEREVGLDELVADNPIVPQDAGHVETEWQLVQDEPVNLHAGRGRTRTRNGRPLAPSTRSVVRRYELYTYTGAYDPVTHEALCVDPTCAAPADGERGDFISAQMAAVNVQGNFVTVTMSGEGSVESTDKLIRCGAKCAASYEEGSTVILTAKPTSRSTFAGWIGDCSGSAPTCTVTATGEVKAYALFKAKTQTTPSCGLLGIEGLVPLAFFAMRRRRARA